MEKNNDPFEKESGKDEDIIDLTEEASSPEDGDDIIELTETTDQPVAETEEDILDLTEPIIEDDPEDEDVLDLVDIAEPAGDQEDIQDLTKPVLQENIDKDDIIGLEDAIEPFSDEEEEILDLSDINDDNLEDVIASSEQIEGLESESEDHILNLTKEAEEGAGDIPEEMPSIVVPGPSDDQEILDLIDDIQSTLDKTGSSAEVTGVDEQEAEEESLLEDETDEASIDHAVLVGNGDSIDSDDLGETDSELLDNLGIDLSSELNQDFVSDEDEKEPIADQDEYIPFEATDDMLGDRLEKIVEQVLHEKLESMIDKRIKEAVQKEFEKLRKDFIG